MFVIVDMDNLEWWTEENPDLGPAFGGEAGEGVEY